MKSLASTSGLEQVQSMLFIFKELREILTHVCKSSSVYFAFCAFLQTLAKTLHLTFVI